jgi:Na+-transporting methylmalonyl-CoA/oxaloacetate decarboxylase gamma subunit
MANNYGRIPSIGSVTNAITNATAAATPFANRSLMNRATNSVSSFLSSTTNLLMMGMGLVLIVFVFLVIYNRTVGDKVRSGWEQIKTILRNKGIIEVEVGPGDAAIKASLTPEPTVVLPPLTATLLPEPVTVPKPADVPPNDGVHVAAEDRPAGMPRATESHVPSLSSISSALFDKDSETTTNKSHISSGSSRSNGSTVGSAEVFNISKNVYTFNDAAAVCAAAGAELATYDQVKAAYDKGADWCNYGWIIGQMAVYPTL